MSSNKPEGMEGKIVCVGDYDVVFPFKAVNLEIHPVTNGDEALKAVKSFVEQGYALVLVQEDYLNAIQEILDATVDKALPAIISIPGSEATRGQALLHLREVIKRAVSMDILASD
jgi:vacuolar-type H+-ATPase subunit F/Vma7